MACECELQNTLDVEVTQDALLDVEIGGSAGVLLQAKSVDITENGTSVVAPDDGFDGLKSVEINTNVPKLFECGDAYFAHPESGATSISIIRLLKTLNASCWDTSNVTNMTNMFGDCRSLQTLDARGWDTSNVTNMTKMFINCFSLQTLDASGWDTSNVTDMKNMFDNCRSLQTLDARGWDTSNVTNMTSMFHTCVNFDMFNIDFLDASNVTSMTNMFANCSSLQTLDAIRWDTFGVKLMINMFYNCNSLQTLDASGWDTSNVTDMTNMFLDCNKLLTLIGDKTLADVENGTVALRGTKVNISTKHCYILRFSSILALANGLADLTGETAKTLTISAKSYNNMYNDDDTVPTADVIAERKARIAAICAAKNWNFAH